MYIQIAKNKKIKNLFILIDELILEEMNGGINFDCNGLPVFRKEHFAATLPTFIRPEAHRLDTPIQMETSICFYEHDKLLYRKLNKSKLCILGNNLRKYHSFIGYDLSIFHDYLFPLQKFYILANLVIDAYLVLFGNKLIPNLRTDQTKGDSYFYIFKDAPIVCCGTLGCSKKQKIKVLNQEEIGIYASNNTDKLIIQYGTNLVSLANTIFYRAYGRKKYE